MSTTINYNLRLPGSLEPRIPELPEQYTFVRVLKAGLPLVVLIPQVGQALQYVAGIANSYESAKKLITSPNDRLNNVVIVVFNISSLALLLVNPIAVSILQSGLDILDVTAQMSKNLIAGQYKQASWKALKVAEKSIYVASIVVGTPKLILISMIAQTSFEIYKFNQFHMNEMELEMAVQVIVIGVRSYGIYHHMRFYENHFQKIYENIKTKIQKSLNISHYQQNDFDLRYGYDPKYNHLTLSHPRSSLDFSKIYPDLGGLTLHYGFSDSHENDLGISGNTKLTTLKLTNGMGTEGFAGAFLPSVKNLYISNNLTFQNMHAFPNLSSINLLIRDYTMDGALESMQLHKARLVEAFLSLKSLKEVHINIFNIESKHRFHSLISELKENFPSIEFTYSFKRAF